MKPEDWVIEDIRTLRQKKDLDSTEQSYLNLLQWYTKLLKEK